MTTPTHETTPEDGQEAYWDLAEPWLGRPEVTRSTMMGFPCLRVRGQFFASTDRGTGDLLVKLPPKPPRKKRDPKGSQG